jgi:hypothetical protein
MIGTAATHLLARADAGLKTQKNLIAVSARGEKQGFRPTPLVHVAGPAVAGFCFLRICEGAFYQ